MATDAEIAAAKQRQTESTYNSVEPNPYETSAAKGTSEDHTYTGLGGMGMKNNSPPKSDYYMEPIDGP